MNTSALAGAITAVVVDSSGLHCGKEVLLRWRSSKGSVGEGKDPVHFKDSRMCY